MIHLNNHHTIIIHMKMTGHLMAGKYEKVGKAQGASWEAIEDGPLQDPYNKFIHLVFSLSDGRQLVLSDARKFASVTISKSDELNLHHNVGNLGPEPLDKSFSLEKFKKIFSTKRNIPIKSLLMDQSVIAGIGNIYSDEILWAVGVHPTSVPHKIPVQMQNEIYKAMQKILNFSI